MDFKTLQKSTLHWTAPSGDQIEVLFVGPNDNGLTQMAEAFAEVYGMKVSSAGRSATVLNPLVMQAMKEIGINISERKPRLLTPEILNGADLIVSIGCQVKDLCPIPLRKEIEEKTITWLWNGMNHQNIGSIRKNRAEVERRVDELYCTSGLTLSPLQKVIPILTV